MHVTLPRLKNIPVYKVNPESLALLQSGQDSFTGSDPDADPFLKAQSLPYPAHSIKQSDSIKSNHLPAMS